MIVEQVSIEIAIERFLDDRAARCMPATVGHYRKSVWQMAYWLKQRDVAMIADIKPQHLVDYINAMKRRPHFQTWRHGPLSIVFIRKSAKDLRTFFIWCNDNHLLPEPIARTIPVPTIGRRLPKALRPEQIKRLLAVDMSARDRAVLFLFLDSGVRITELISFDKSDVDLNECIANVRHGKGDKERMVVFTKRTADAIHAYLKERGEDADPAMFLTNHYGPGGQVVSRMSRDACYRLVKQAGKRCGLEASVRPHVLRHSFATQALRNGAKIQNVSALMGHNDLTTTMIYVSVSMETLRLEHPAISPLNGMVGEQAVA
jgi:site-specific recombinase XerD